MIVHECQQGSEEWFGLRRGIPTGSGMNRIVTAKTLKPSAQREKYMNELIAEWWLGETDIDSLDTPFTMRGTNMEEEARRWYAFHYDAKVRQVGFISTDDGLIGASPDGLVGDHRGLEIKCPKAANHVGYISDMSKLVSEYRLQIQTNLWISERDHWDVVTYNPELPPQCIAVDRDEEAIKVISTEARKFVDELLERRERMAIMNEGE